MDKRDKKYKVEKSCEKYKSYDPNVWSLEFFDPKTGGYVVVNRKRKANALRYKNEGTKYGKELKMVKVFACGGHQIEMLEEISRIPSPDVMIDGIPADLKFHATKRISLIMPKRLSRKRVQGLCCLRYQRELTVPKASSMF